MDAFFAVPSKNERAYTTRYYISASGTNDER
jgi:hypothetical protein